MFVVCIIVSVVLALALAGSAAGKLTKNPKVMEGMTAVGVPVAWLPRLALAELAGEVGLLVGLAVAPLGIAAAIGVIAYFLGAVAAHVRAKDKNLIPPAALGVVAVVALVLRIVTL